MEEESAGRFLSVAQRQARLLDYVRNEVFADAQALKDSLGVSIATVRRDLNDLEARGLLKRTHGGAAVVNQATLDYETRVREVTNVSEKSRIGAAAAELVVDGDAVMIDSGTTSLEVARRLAGRKSLTFVTNGTDILSTLVAGGVTNIYFIGGEYIDVNHSLGGAIAVEMVRRFSVDKAILSVASVDLARGTIATLTPQMAMVQKAMIEVAKTTIVVADHSKFDRTALSIIASLAEIDHVVTDSETRARIGSTSDDIRKKFIFA